MTQTSRNALALAARITGHTIGVLTLSVVSATILSGGTHAWSTILASPWRDKLLADMLPMLALHVGIISFAWFSIVALAKRRRAPVRHVRAFRPARGTVMLEFLMVLTPFMLLTSGLIQMTINNITHVLAHVAVYQAGRTVWVWTGESGNVQKKARLAAASVMAPTAPAMNGIPNLINDTELKDLRGTMTAQFTPGVNLMNNAGSTGKSIASGLIALDFKGATNVMEGLDGQENSSFAGRAARKLTNAYGGTKITVINGSQVGARLRYWHFNSMPWYGSLFGKLSVTVGDLPAAQRAAGGYYTPYNLEFTLPKQVNR